MPDTPDSASPYHGQSPITVIPVTPPPPPPPRPSPFGWIVRWFLFFFLACSLALNLLLLIVLSMGGDGLSNDSAHVHERWYAGSATSHDKVAIVSIEGILMEGMLNFVHREIEHAAGDDGVKSVVLRINSPGGSITSSDDLHRRIVELRDGNPVKRTNPKPIIVSMASVAASGGYYVAMPARQLFAERTTITGSIGVFAALPNVTELGKKVGFSMNVIKAGEVKDSGSMFHEMTPKERQVWQAMVDHSYLQFLQVVEEGRPQLKGKLQEDLVINETVPVRDEKGMSKHENYVRYRADGGIFTADLAKKYGLIDEIGYLQDAVKAAKQAAGLPEDARVVLYERPMTLFGSLLGVRAAPPAEGLDPAGLASAATPRLWYLAPQSELAGILAAAASRP